MPIILVSQKEQNRNLTVWCSNADTPTGVPINGRCRTAQNDTRRKYCLDLVLNPPSIIVFNTVFVVMHLPSPDPTLA